MAQHLQDWIGSHREALSVWIEESLTRQGCYRWLRVRMLGLDYGTKRIGIAVSDPGGVVAQPLETLEVRHPREALPRLRDLVGAYDVSRIVVGLPVHMNGREGPEAEEVRAFGASIVTATGIPVDYQDERWTTVEAERMLRSGGVRRRRREKRRDQIAAALLLQTYLERGAS